LATGHVNLLALHLHARKLMTDGNVQQSDLPMPSAFSTP